MSHPNNSEPLDETLVQSDAKPTQGPRADATVDFSSWTWAAKEPISQMVPLSQSAAPATSEPSSRPTHDETLVHSMLAEKQETRHIQDELDQTLVHAPDEDAVPDKTPPVVARSPDRATTGATTGEELDQTLVHAPDDDAPDTTEGGLDGTLVRPTVSPRRADTRALEEPDQTLVNPPEAVADPDATAGESQPPAPRQTAPLGPGRPTDVLDPTVPIRDKKARQGPSFQTAGDRYDIQGTLGRGGMGVVYKARDKQLNRLVALKMILSGAHASPETLMRFRIEAEAVAKLQHPNIVQIFDSGVRDGHPFFSLEYLDGGSLHQKLDGKAQLPRQAAVIIETLARAIHYAHLHGIVHRDMKPANVLLASDGAMKITDFGLAKQLDVEDSGQTGTEAILGTPTYMAPEQAAGRTKEVGPAADVYALGAMLYEMLTGRPPFRGNTIMETLQQVQHVEPIQPRRLQPNAPLDLQTICLKCLNKEPNKRYASADALADDLRAYLEDRPIKARPISTPERLYKWMRRQPMQAALVLVSLGALVGLVGGIAHSLYQQSELRQIAEDKAATETKARIDAVNAAETIRTERDAKETQRALAVKNEAEANENEKLAKSNAARAKQNFALAKEAVDRLTVLAQQNLADRPGLEKVRDDLLNRVAAFYEEFIKTNKDESLTQEKGDAYYRLGSIQQTLGKNTDAAASYRKACDSYLLVLQRAPKDEAARRALAETSINLWVVLTDLGKEGEAAAAIEQAHQLLIGLHADFPNTAKYLRNLAMCENDYGLRDIKAGKLDAAEQHLKAALAELGKATGPDAKLPYTQLEWVRAYSTLGILYRERAQTADKPEEVRAESAQMFAKALDYLDPLVKAHPDSSEIAHELGAVYTNLGLMLNAKKDKTDALNNYAKVIGLFKDLSEKYPDVTDYRHMLALNRSNRGDLLGQQKQFDAARADLQAAVEALAQMAEGFPKRPIYRLNLAQTYNRLGVIHEATGQRELAQQNWERADKLLADLVDTYPKRDEYREERKRSLDYLIRFHDRQVRESQRANRWPQAAAATARLVDAWEKMAALFPNDSKAKGELASARLALVAVQVRAENAAEADKALAEFLKHRKEIPPQWGKLYQAALVAYACLDLSGKNTTLSPSVLTEQCLELLRGAIDQNEHIIIGPDDFKSLRNNTDFKDMLAEIERKHKKAGETP